MMSASSEEDGNIPHPPEIHEIQEIEGPQAISAMLNYCQIIFKTVQGLEKKFDEMDEKVKKIYYARSRSFWNYPPLRSATRKYNYLVSKRAKVQKVKQVSHDSSFTYPQSYSSTSPVRRREEYNQDTEDIESMDYTQPFQYSDTINNSQTFQYTDAVDNQTVQYTDTVDNQTVQYTDTVDLTQTSQYTDAVDNQAVQYTDTVDLTQTVQYTDIVDLTQTVQYTDIVDLTQTVQYTDLVDLTQTAQYTNTVNNTEGIQNTENTQEVAFARSLPERDYQETPPSPTYTTQTYEQYYRFKDVPGSSTMPYYSDFEIPNMNTITSAISTARESSTLPPGELIPIRNPEMRRMALLEAQLSPVIDPNTFGSLPECNSAVLRHLGEPKDWTVNDVITFLNRLDPPLADQLYPVIKKHDIDGKALLLINSDTMIKYMWMKVGVAKKFENYIQKLKEVTQ